MDETLLQILEILEPGGIGGVNEISDIINQFPIPPNKREFDIQRKRILDFLKFISDDIEFFRDIDGQISVYDENNMPTRWVEWEMRVTLTNIGLKHLDEHRLLVSTIQLNESTLRSNGIISANTTTQSTIFRFQTGVFVFGAAFACLSFITAYKSYVRDNKTIALKSYIISLKKDSILLQNKLSDIKTIQEKSQKKHDTLYVKIVK